MQTTIEPKRMPIFWILLVLAVAVGVVLMAKINPSAHSIAKHGAATAYTAARCMDNNVTPPNQKWFYLRQKEGEKDRWAIVCKLPNGKFGVNIIDNDGKSITSFIKDKMKRIEQVTGYLANQDYLLVQVPKVIP